MPHNDQERGGGKSPPRSQSKRLGRFRVFMAFRSSVCARAKRSKMSATFLEPPCCKETSISIYFSSPVSIVVKRQNNQRRPIGEIARARDTHRDIVSWSVGIHDGQLISLVGIVHRASDVKAVPRLLLSTFQHVQHITN